MAGLGSEGVLPGLAWEAFIRVLVALLLAVCVTNHAIDQFYVTGASVWDAGWFAWLASHADAWPMPNPPLIGGSFLAIHASPVFFLLTALKSLLPAMPDPVWFALTQGLWAGLLGLAVALCLGPGWRAACLSILIAGNGITLAAIGFPHIELAMPALLLLSLALRRSTVWLWLPPLLLLFTIREDGGCHAALAFAALAALRAWQEQRLAAARGDAAIAGLCLLASATAILVQHLLPQGGAALGGTYLGHPPLAHVDAAFLADRLHHLFKDRAYVWAPLLLLGLAGLIWRDLRLLAGVVIALPWLTLSVLAVSHQAGEMWDYYSLPLMAPLCWPLLCSARLDGAPRGFLRLQIVMSALSAALFIGSNANHDRRPWLHFQPGGWARVAETEAALDALVAEPGALDHLVVDDAVAALRLGAFRAANIHAGFDYSKAEQRQINRLIYLPGTWRDDRKRALIASEGLTDPRRFAGRFISVTRPAPAAPP